MFFKLSPMNCVCPSLLFVSKICLHKRFLHILFCVSGCPSAVLYVSITISHDVKLRSCIKLVFANYCVRLRIIAVLKGPNDCPDVVDAMQTYL